MLAAIPSPTSSGLQLGPLEVHVYGLMYVVGLAAAVLIAGRRWERQGGSRALVYEVAMWGFPAGVVGGRLYFDLTSSNLVPPHWWGPFAIWDGGMGIWGGIALGSLVGAWRLRRAGVSVTAFMDAAAPALLVGQAIGRIGNYFNQELFGGPTSLPWALEISPPTARPATSASPPSTPPSSTSWPSTWRWRRSSSGSATTAASARRACSPSTSPATRPSGSSRSRCGSTRPTIFSVCG